MIIQSGDEVRLFDHHNQLIDKHPCNGLKSKQFWAKVVDQFQNEIDLARNAGFIEGKTMMREKLISRLKNVESGIRTL